MSAPMPGVILDVNVTAGAQVAKGDVVMVLEAMKMKNELHASRTGVIEDVLVASGEQVKYGQLLLRFVKD
nr:biotin/lipoyl-containing protein [Brooklawnia cerclae]